MQKPKVHIAGIGGEGWSWIAKILVERSWDVSGCDAVESARTEFLKSLNVDISIGNSPSHISKELDYFLYSSALPFDGGAGQQEVQIAKKMGIPTHNRNEFLPILLKDNKTIAIAGTHGKTTTTSITAYLLDALGDKCGFGVGGTVNNFGTNGRAGESDTFVIEADEFDNSFLGLNQQIAVVTSLEYDHQDFFKTFEDYKKSFTEFVSGTKDDGYVVGFGDSQEIQNILTNSGKQIITYGEEKSNIARTLNIQIVGFDTKWILKYKGKSYECIIPFPGKQYTYNATAAVLVSALMGHDVQQAIDLLSGYKGAGRRFQKFEKNGITVINDYGHHPTEVKITTQGALGTGNRIIVVFEPHQYKRAVELKEEFRGVFEGADVLIQTDIYASREQPPYPITNEGFFDVCKEGAKEFFHIGNYQNAPAKVKEIAKKGDIILVLAVGHGDRIVTETLNLL